MLRRRSIILYTAQNCWAERRVARNIHTSVTHDSPRRPQVLQLPLPLPRPLFRPQLSSKPSPPHPPIILCYSRFRFPSLSFGVGTLGISAPFHYSHNKSWVAPHTKSIFNVPLLQCVKGYVKQGWPPLFWCHLPLDIDRQVTSSLHAPHWNPPYLTNTIRNALSGTSGWRFAILARLVPRPTASIRTFQISPFVWRNSLCPLASISISCIRLSSLNFM